MGFFRRLRAPAVDEARWVMVDVETSGLDPARDRLLAVAGIGLRIDWRSKRLAIVLADSFEAVLREDEPSPRDNILLHGIGVQRQRGGLAAPHALRAFAAYAGASPLLAFHAAFDRTVVNRRTRLALATTLRNPWLDIEHLCGAAYPRVPARSLDEWMAHFSLECATRHQPAADALVQCELLLRVWPRLAAECSGWRDVERVAAGHRWLGRA